MDLGLGPLDASFVADTLSRLPFVSIPGVTNVRDLGHYETCPKGKVTRPGFVFRSAEISSITDEGKSRMRDLGITTVFDLRSDTEIRKYGTPQPTIEGVEVLWTPVFKTEDYSPEMMAKRFQLYASGKTEAFMELYAQILDHAPTAFAAIFCHLRDKPNEGFLIHCTAGKDRTGVIAALILKLAGVPDETIARDYALTRVGREVIREKIMARLAKEPFFASNNQAALNMFTCRPDTMMAFLQLLHDKYGGVKEYLKRYLDFSEDDIHIILNNLLTSSPNGSRG